jgi:CDP-6-deoxy-D-xylo-4-hexulose-3-dehydrase
MSSEPRSKEEVRAAILELTREFHALNWPETEFVPGQSPVPVSGRVFDADEVVSLVDSSLDFWLTTGRFAEQFENDFAKVMGLRHCLLVNSGSSANLLAMTALTSPELGERRLRPGDEVITTAAGFPTTVNPIVQNGLVPVFLDAELPTYNIDTTRLEEAVGPRTKAIMVAHALGNPFRLDQVREIADRHGLWLIEDCRDAVGSTFGGQGVGTFGDLATVSFYPAHHLTMGEGGAVLTQKPLLKKLVESLRDWGRDCWCDPGVADTCRKRFDW